MISNRYNQVPHLTFDTIRESDKTQINTKQDSQEVSHFPAGDHKTTKNRQDSILTRQTWHINNKNDP